MAKERKTRRARKKIDTSSLKEFGAGDDFQSRGQQKLAFAKTVKEEADSVQSQIEEEQAKAQEKSLWSSIGGALGGLALGLATGGLGLAGLAGTAAAGIGAGLGTYGGAHIGKSQSEKKSGKRKQIKSDMFYENEADKQNLAFSEFDKKLNDSILTRSLAAGVMAAAFTGGGKLIEKMKEGKSARAAAAASKAAGEAAGEGLKGYKTLASGETVLNKEGLGLPSSLKKAQEGFESVINTDISGTGKSVKKLASNITTKPSIVSETGASMSFEDILWDGGTDKQFADALSGDFNLAPSGNIDVNSFANSNLAFKEGIQSSQNSLTNNQLFQNMTSSFTPLTDEIGPSIMDSYLKGIAGQKSKSTQQSLLATGGMSLYGYRPELDSLRQVQFGTNIKPYG